MDGSMSFWFQSQAELGLGLALLFSLRADGILTALLSSSSQLSMKMVHSAYSVMADQGVLIPPQLLAASQTSGTHLVAL